MLQHLPMVLHSLIDFTGTFRDPQNPRIPFFATSSHVLRHQYLTHLHKIFSVTIPPFGYVGCYLITLWTFTSCCVGYRPVIGCLPSSFDSALIFIVCSSAAMAPIFSGKAQSPARPVSLVLVPLVRNFSLLRNGDVWLMGCHLHFLCEQA